MSESAEGGAALAWRLLAALEGGSLLLCASASALLAYGARPRARAARPVRTVLVSNTSNALGKEIKSRLESRGCVVSVPSDTSGAGAEADNVDALVVVGEDACADSLDGMANLVSRDVYDNLKVLEALSPRVHRGGCVAWACAGAPSASFRGAGAAFDTVLYASLRHVANRLDCIPVWVGRHATAAAAERVAAALVPCTTRLYTFSFRNAAHKVSEYVGRWLKIVT